MKAQNKQDGITLFVTLMLMGVLLGVSASLLNITLKQYQLAGVSYASEVAFQAANAGMECALSRDWNSDHFDVGGTRDGFSCFGISAIVDLGGPYGNGDTLVDSGELQLFQFTWPSSGTNQVCTEFSVYKFFEDPDDDSNTNGPWVEVGTERFKDERCPEGSECTVIKSRGYNVSCNDIESGVRVVEREYTQVY